MDGIRVLGSLEVVVDGVMRPLGGPRRRRLLSVLVLSANRVVSNDRLLDLVWDSDAGSGALRSLRSEVSRLRSVLEGVATIVGEGGGYRLEIEAERLDVVRFEALINEAGLADEPTVIVGCLDEALALWRGHPYSEIADTVETAVAVGQQLDEARLAAVVSQAEALLAIAGGNAGKLGEVVATLRGLVKEYPHQERLWALLMTALYRVGRQADALAAYQELRNVLVEELGIEPAAELVSLEERILQQDPILAAAISERLDRPSTDDSSMVSPPIRLPRQRTTLLGRSDDVDELLQRLTRSQIVCVVGPGGAGKTRAAIEVGAQAAASFDGHVYFVDLSVVREATAVSGALLEAVRLQSEAGVTPMDLVASRIGDRRALFVVDNCEHLIDAAVEVLLELTERCEAVTVLATSREPLGIDGEQVYRLPALASDDENSAAVRLFVERACAADSDFDPTFAELGTIREICEDLGGMPLAIELAAARVRSLAVGEIASRLGERLELTSTGRRTPPRHHTLRAALEWSVALLDDDERKLLRRLGVFVGGWRLAALAPVTGTDDGTAVRLLDSLVAKSLVEREGDHDGSTRYRLAETVREWAIEQCEQEDELETLRRGHAEHIRVELDTWSMWRFAAPDFYRYWQPEAPNLVAAVNWLALTDPPLSVDLLAPAVEIFVTGGKGTWCLDALETNLGSNLVLGDRRLFGLTRLLLGSFLMIDRGRSATTESQLPADPNASDAGAYLAVNAAISSVTADPHNSEEVIDSLESSRDAVTDLEAFELLCVALQTNRLALIGHSEAAVEAFIAGASGHDIGGLWVNSAAGAALVCAYTTQSPQLEVIAGMTRNMNRCEPLFDGGVAALVAVTGPGSVEDRSQALAAMANNGAYSAMPRYESIYLACFARLRFERGDHRRAQQLLDATSMRSAAISVLVKATVVELQNLSPETAISRDFYQSLFAHRRTPEWDNRTDAAKLLDQELDNWR